jgi:hypothetical protein
MSFLPMQAISLSVGGVLNYAVLAAVLGAAVAAVSRVFHEQYKNRLRRQGIARLLYHRLLQCQSTLATAYYAKHWWSEDEFDATSISSDDTKRVATALGASEWRIVISAIGWIEHLRTRQKQRLGSGLGEDDLERIRKTYAKLEVARWALRGVCGRGQRLLSRRAMPWDVHNHLDALELVSREGCRPTLPPLRNLPPDRCKEELKNRKSDDHMPCADCGHPHLRRRSAVEKALAVREACTGCVVCDSDWANIEVRGNGARDALQIARLLVALISTLVGINALLDHVPRGSRRASAVERGARGR